MDDGADVKASLMPALDYTNRSESEGVSLVYEKKPRRLEFTKADSAIRKVLRQEQKYLLTIDEYMSTCAAVSRCIAADKHNGADGYMVRSLYFDTLPNSDYYEKADGVDVRRKLRLRVYSPDADCAYLEMKQKQSYFQLKRSLKVSRADAECLCRGLYSVLLKYDDPFALECFSLMCIRAYRPAAIVEYRRQAFIINENKTRVTFDRELCATESCFDVFDRELMLYPVMEKSSVIMEVKFNGFLLGYVKDLVSRHGKSALAHSKYCLGRSATLH